MVELDQEYKVVYWIIFFLMFLHTYFVIFLTEGKIRLSSKFHSKKWKEQTSGVLFDGVLYLEQVGLEDNCSKGYSEYPIYTWPGTYQGVFLNNYTYDNKCFWTDNSKKSEVKFYKINSIYSPSFDNNDIYIDYVVDTPYKDKCYDGKNNTCTCDKFLVSSFQFMRQYGKNYNLSQKNNIINKEGREITNISAINQVHFSYINNKKLCMKKVTNYTIGLSQDNDTLENGVQCGLLYLSGEKYCPNYENILHSFNVPNDKIPKNVLISSLDYHYNGIKCSLLNKNLTPPRTLLEEAKFPLSRFNQSNKHLKEEKVDSTYCTYNNSYEDVILLDHFNSIDLYDKLNITNKIRETIDDKINNYNLSYMKLINTSEIYFSASSYFNLNETSVKNNLCSKTTLQEVKFSIETARKIYLINIGNLFILEFCFILSFCYLLYKHFKLLSIKTQPQNKFYFVKHVLVITFFLFCFNLILYYTNKNHKIDIQKSIKYLEQMLSNNCFTNKNYIKYLKKIKKRLEDFSFVSYKIYENLLFENVAVSVLLIVIVRSKITIREFLRLKGNEK